MRTLDNRQALEGSAGWDRWDMPDERPGRESRRAAAAFLALCACAFLAGAALDAARAVAEEEDIGAYGSIAEQGQASGGGSVEGETHPAVPEGDDAGGGDADGGTPPASGETDGGDTAAAEPGEKSTGSGMLGSIATAIASGLGAGTASFADEAAFEDAIASAHADADIPFTVRVEDAGGGVDVGLVATLQQDGSIAIRDASTDDEVAFLEASELKAKADKPDRHPSQADGADGSNTALDPQEDANAQQGIPSEGTPGEEASAAPERPAGTADAPAGDADSANDTPDAREEKTPSSGEAESATDDAEDGVTSHDAGEQPGGGIHPDSATAPVDAETHDGGQADGNAMPGDETASDAEGPSGVDEAPDGESASNDGATDGEAISNREAPGGGSSSDEAAPDDGRGSEDATVPQDENPVFTNAAAATALQDAQEDEAPVSKAAAQAAGKGPGSSASPQTGDIPATLPLALAILAAGAGCIVALAARRLRAPEYREW